MRISKSTYLLALLFYLVFGSVGHASLNGPGRNILTEGHAIQRHGGAVTNNQLLTRATTGVAPDGSKVVRNGQVIIPKSSTAFNSDQLLLDSDLLLRQNYLDRAIALSKPGATRVTLEGVDVGTTVGRGFDRVNVSPGKPGPLNYHDNLSKVNASYKFNVNTQAWDTVTIYPVK